MVKTCDNCGKELAFLEERTYENPDGKKMRLCINCDEKIHKKPYPYICTICEKKIEIGQFFIVDGTFPKLPSWRYLNTTTEFEIIKKINDFSKGNIYHKECYIKNLKLDK